MTLRTHLGHLLIAGAWAGCAASLGTAQTAKPADPAPCAVAPQPEPCGTKPAPTARERFPFPGSASAENSSAPDASVPSAPGLNGAPGAPDQPASAAPAGKKEFPFPGTPGAPGASAITDTGGSSSSSNSGDVPAFDPDAADATPALKDKGSEGTQVQPGRHILHRVNPVGTKLLTVDERVAEDLDIAHFYVQSGNLQGAYLRNKDAVKIAPDDTAAHFALAEIAEKLNKRDEAIAEYNACLKLDPDEKQIKASRKALARLKP